jgi:hypothetical protein
MHPKLQRIAEELGTASDRLAALVGLVPEDVWGERPREGGWSVAECVAHLNLTGAAYLPALREALAGAEALRGARVRYRRDVMGWLLWRSMGPPVRMRLRTTAPFVPAAVGTRDELVAEFDRLQDEQVALVRRADGLPLQKIRIRSPFDERVSYNLFSALGILPRHQHRHLWQAEQVAARAAGGAVSGSG